MDVLETVDDVIDALGGTFATAAITGRKPSAVSMWRKRGALAPGTYVILSEKLETIGKSAPASLWRMDEAAE